MRIRFVLPVAAMALLATLTISAQTNRKGGAPKPKPNTPATDTKAKQATAEPAPAKSAEDNKPLRKEIEAKSISDNYQILTAGKNGVILLYPSSDKSTKGKKFVDWIWTRYNTGFEEQFNKIMSVSEDLSYVQNYVDEQTGHLYALFAKADATPTYPAADGYLGNFEVYDMDLANNNLNVTSGILAKKMRIAVFKSVGDNLYLGGANVPTRKQLMGAACATMATCFIGGKKRFDIFPYMVRIKGSRTEEMNFGISGQGEILGVEYDSLSNTTYAAVMDVPVPITRKLTIYELNNTPTASKGQVVQSQSGFVLLNAQLQNISKTEKIVIGSYTKEEGKDKIEYGLFRTNRKTMRPSAGFYICKLNGNKQEYIKFYPFSKFDDVQETVNEKTKDIKNAAKKEKKAKKLSDPLANVNLLIHKLVQRGDELVIIGDAYYAHYHTETRTSYDASTHRTTTTTVQVFDGWMFTHSLLAGFDGQGNMKWNTMFDLPEKLTWRIKPQTKILQNPGSDKIVMVYNYGGSITSKVLNGSTLESSNDVVKIDTFRDQDKVKSEETYQSEIEYWYDNYFIAYGFDKIKTKEKEKDAKSKKRTLFYFNKVAYM